MYQWSLNKLYSSLEDPRYLGDLAQVDLLIKENENLLASKASYEASIFLEKALLLQEELTILFSKLFQFVSLSLATDVSNVLFNNALVGLRKKFVATTLSRTQLERYISNLANLEEVIKTSSYLEKYRFILLEIKNNSLHLLSDQEEVLASELNQSGGSLFAKMQGDLTSTLNVDYKGEVIALSKVRNLAYSSDSNVRKEAYFAEMKSYEKINKATSFALHGIKKEVLTMSKKRKFASPLEETLVNSRLTKKALDALLQAMGESLDDFRAYLKQKALLLGHKNGLPFYDLFAPMGSLTSKYTIEEAQEFILTHFYSYANDLGDLAKRAFNEQWIDYLPKQGKRGGAFCAGIYAIKESRILTNYDGSIGDISTLAHELGHAYHNYHLRNEAPLNTSYPMPIAETASILCETIVKKKALELAKTQEEKIGLIEQELQDATQVIVDIYSRYLFEAEVFARIENEFLNEDALDKIMLKAQLASYGDGLDPNYLHPRMWINKSHYYSTGRSYYNFPYAFGLLFAKGVYAKYQEQGPAFTKEIAKLLAMTGKSSILDVSKEIGIDIENPTYWKKALNIIKDDIDTFIKLTNQKTT